MVVVMRRFTHRPTVKPAIPVTWPDRAKALQRQGFTMREISERLKVEYAEIERALYWDIVR